MTIITINNINFTNKEIIVRLDLNVPINDGKILDSTRIKRAIPTLEKLLSSKPKYILIVSHLGRPKASHNNKDSLLPVAKELEILLGQPVIFSKTTIGADLKAELEAITSKQGNSSVIMLENVRFYEGEESNSSDFSKLLSSLGNVFVNDAFSCSHRSHASVVGITNYLPSYAGLCFESELAALESCLEKPDRPVMGIVAGSKVSTKIDLLLNLLNKLDYLFLGGGIANTILCAKGYKMGGSLIENDRLGVAESILQKAKTSNCQLLLPIDAVVANKLSPNIQTHVVDIDKISMDQSMYDIGPKTIEIINNTLNKCKTVLWNGPVGVYEIPPFADGSIAIAQTIANLTDSHKIKSIAGGGDTIAAVANMTTSFSYTSTAGGAFLECLEGKILPGVEALKNN